MIPAFVNPAAGNADAAREALEAAGGFDVRIVDPARIADAVRDAVRAGAKRILVAGGDGTIGTAAGIAAPAGVELAILPSGTVNHFAEDLGLPSDIGECVRVARDGRAVSVDSGSVNGRLFLNTSSVGAYVSFVRLRDGLEQRLGYRLANIVAALRMLAHVPTFRVTVEADGVAREYLSSLVFIGVGERELKLPTLGARVASGRPGLHVMVVRRRSGARTIAFALAAMARGVASVSRTPAMDAFLVDRCRVATRARRAALDGEIVDVMPPLEYTHQSACLKVVVP